VKELAQPRRGVVRWGGMDETPALDHERLDVYRCATDFLRFALRACAAVPRGDGELRDQLRRAAISIPLNIAEGSGKTSIADRSRYFSIARGSALECGALLDVLRLTGAVAEPDGQDAKKLLARIVSMLTRLCRASSC
jgi:four helix bundle protein